MLDSDQTRGVAEMRFLRVVAGYRLIDKISDKDIREEVFCLSKKIKEYQVNGLQHFNRIED